MKFFLLAATTVLLFACGSTKQAGENIIGTYNVSCGMCNFDMTGDDCALAIEVNDKYYYVEGSTLEAHGDAHAEDGLCTVVRQAQVKGSIQHGVFVAEKFEMLPFVE